MGKGLTKYWILVIYWTAITCLISFISFIIPEEASPGERGLTGICFAASSILATLPFVNKLFIRTLHNHKTLAFLIKFVLMTLFLGVVHVLLAELFSHFDIKGFLTLRKIRIGGQTLAGQLLITMPGTMTISLLLCTILLYYEYSILQKALLESQLQVLHAQINPHFMFNVLNYIHVLMQKDTELASELLLKYADTLRYQLYNGKQEAVRLEQEVVFLKNFIDVEKFRWKDKLDVTCTWHIENGNKNIPPLMFIPFIENAFKHVSRSANEKGFIYINLEQRKNILSLKVENSKSNKAPKKGKEGGIGLENIRKRLDIHYGERYSLTVKEMDTIYFLQLIICM
ncbi:MAG: histidine kinase [Tannerellaceae bacterium]|jgi:sensor histidine kinase YesM|nr:histidine kinase [Tannerellaceae bacterium]